MASGRSREETFFIYDHTVLQKEEDDLKDAIIYFYPQTASVEEQCGLCGQLMGMVTFCTAFAGSPPSLYRLHHVKIAIKHLGRYTLALGGSTSLPDSVLQAQLDQLYNIFVFYHRDLEEVRQMCEKEERDHLDYLGLVWDTYVPFIRHYGDDFQAAMQAVPVVSVPKSLSCMFLQASHLLQSCQRAPGVIAGCLLLKDKVVCTQMTSTFTYRLLIVRPHQTHLPCQLVQTDFTLPVGIRLLCVHITKEEAADLRPTKTRWPSRRHHGKTRFHFPDSVRRRTSSTSRTPTCRKGSCSQHYSQSRAPSGEQQAFSLNPNAGSGFKMSWKDLRTTNSGSHRDAVKSDQRDTVHLDTTNDTNTPPGDVIQGLGLAEQSRVEPQHSSLEIVEKVSPQTSEEVGQNPVTDVNVGHNPDPGVEVGHTPVSGVKVGQNPETVVTRDEADSIQENTRASLDLLVGESDTAKIRSEHQEEENTSCPPEVTLSLTAQLERHIESSPVHKTVATISEISCAAWCEPSECPIPIPAEHPSNLAVSQDDSMGKSASEQTVYMESSPVVSDSTTVTNMENTLSNSLNPVWEPDPIDRDSLSALSKEQEVVENSDKVVFGELDSTHVVCDSAKSTDTPQNVPGSRTVEDIECQCAEGDICLSATGAKLISSEGSESVKGKSSKNFTGSGEHLPNAPEVEDPECEPDAERTSIENSDIPAVPSGGEYVVDASESPGQLENSGIKSEHIGDTLITVKTSLVESPVCNTSVASDYDKLATLERLSDEPRICHVQDTDQRESLLQAGSGRSDGVVDQCPVQDVTESQRDVETKSEEEPHPESSRSPEHNAPNTDKATCDVDPKGEPEHGRSLTLTSETHIKDNDVSLNRELLPSKKQSRTVELFKAVKQVATKNNVIQQYDASMQYATFPVIDDASNLAAAMSAASPYSSHMTGAATSHSPVRSSSGGSVRSLSKPDETDSHDSPPTLHHVTYKKSGQRQPSRKKSSVHRKSTSSDSIDKRTKTKWKFSSSSEMKESQNEPHFDITSGNQKEPGSHEDGHHGNDDDLETLELYIQGNAELLLLLLLERGTSQDKNTVHTLWKWALPQLGDLDLVVKQGAEISTSQKLKPSPEYNHLLYNSSQKTLSGSVMRPVTSQESEFCDAVIHMNDAFGRSANLTDITLSAHHAYIYGHRSFNQQTYFQQNNSARNSPGVPTDRDQAMCTDAKAYQKLFAEQNSLVI